MPAPVTGQAVGTGIGNAVPFSSSAVYVTAWQVKAPLTNTGPVYVGPAGVSSTTGYQMDPGDVETYERISQNGQPRYELNPSDFFVAGATGDKVTWLASPAA